MKQSTNNGQAEAQDSGAVTRTETDMKELETLEQTIRQGMDTFTSVGKALIQINARKLYQLRGYKSFDDYCKGELHLSKAHGYRLIKHIETCKAIAVSPSEVPEKVTRTLSAIKNKEEQSQLWKEAKRENGGLCPSSRAMEKKVKDHISSKQTPEQKQPVPEESAASERSIYANTENAADKVLSIETATSMAEVLAICQGPRLSEQEEAQLQELIQQSLTVDPAINEKHMIAFEQGNHLFELIIDNRKTLSHLQVETGMDEVKCRLIQYIESMPDEE